MAPPRRPIEWTVTADGCWDCTSHSRDITGRPQLGRGRDGKRVVVRVVNLLWEEKHGPIPAGMSLCRKATCPLRGCINPDHHFVGTNRDGQLVRAKRGGGGRLSEAQAILIRAEPSLEAAKALAVSFGASPDTAYQVRRARSFAWLGPAVDPLLDREAKTDGFGEWLRQRREALNISQEGLARLSGMHYTAISHIERGSRRPAARTETRLRAAMENPDAATLTRETKMRKQANSVSGKLLLRTGSVEALRTLTYRTKRMTQAHAFTFARCLSAQPGLFAEVWVEREKSAKDQERCWVVAYEPVSDQAKEELLNLEFRKNLKRALDEGGRYYWDWDERGFWRVQSVSGQVYEVTADGKSCSCPQFVTRCRAAGLMCKHLLSKSIGLGRGLPAPELELTP